MAHNVIGLDLGSHSVKAVVVRMGMRGFDLEGYESEAVTLDEDGRSTPDEVLAAAGRLMKRVGGPGDTVHCAVPGEAATLRLVELPPSASRRLDQVLRFELDDSLPFSVDEAVFDHVEVARTSEAITLLSAVVRTGVVQSLLEGLGEHGVDPREVGVAALSYASLVDRGEWADIDDVAAVIDIGHQRTDLFVFGDSITTTRTLLRGGRDLTAALTGHWNLSFAEAEAYKTGYGLEDKVGEALGPALKPFVRELRQTLKGHEAAGGRPVKRVLLVGGGARLKGIEAYLQEELGVPVEIHLTPADRLGDPDARAGAHGGGGLAYALALREGIPRARMINLRRGALAFKGDYEFLKRRMAWVAVCLLGVLVAWIFANYAQYQVLEDQVARQREKLIAETTKLFGKELTDSQEITDELKGGEAEKVPIPETDAFDIVVELSRRIPPEVIHDVELLEIKPKRITLKGIVDSDLKLEGAEEDAGPSDAGTALSPIDLTKQELEKFTECFTAIRVGKVTVSGERKKYQMDIETKCP